MNTFFRLSLFGVVLIFLVPVFLHAKIWTSSDGRTLEAELVEYKDGVAKLQRPNGTVVSVKKEQLSQADQDFLENLSQTEPPSLPLEVKMEPHAISIAKKMPHGEESHMMWGMDHEGTRITLLVQVSDYSIVALDEEASRLTRFSDDKNTDLLKTDSGTGGIMGNLMGGMMGNMEPNQPPIQARMMRNTTGKQIFIDCSAPNCPAPGTQTITLEGRIILQCGQGVKMTEHKNVPLDGSGKFTAGGVSVAIKKEESGGFGNTFGGMGQEMKMRISFTSNKPLDGVISYTFLDTNGNEIEWQDGGWMGTNQTHTEYFSLAEEVDSLTIQLEEYETIETITLPVSLKVGLGL